LEPGVEEEEKEEEKEEDSPWVECSGGAIVWDGNPEV
jgi:hypothetical protein